jgi:hypothetical protein
VPNLAIRLVFNSNETMLIGKSVYEKVSSYYFEYASVNCRDCCG